MDSKDETKKRLTLQWEIKKSTLSLLCTIIEMGI